MPPVVSPLIPALLTDIGRPFCAQNGFQLGWIGRRGTNAVTGSTARTEGDNLGVRICNGGKGKQEGDDRASEHPQQSSRLVQAIICTLTVCVKIAPLTPGLSAPD
jgi:hypothetical protein